MKFIKLILSSIIVISLFSCFSKKSNTDENTITTKQEINGTPVTVKIKIGTNYSDLRKNGPIAISIIPQIAFWIEDMDGNYIDTIFVTQKFGKQSWTIANTDKNKTFRTSSLPYFMNKRIKAGLNSPTRNSPLADSETGATPKQDFSIKSKIKPDLKKFKILAEFNKSFDVNENFHANENRNTPGAVNGQPSVIFSADIDLTKPVKNYSMKIAGHGGEDGNDANLYTETGKLTTALKIIDSILVSF